MADEENPQLPLTPPPGGDGGGTNAGNIQPINIEEEMRRSYLDYSMSVIIGRALPDVRDGLKPVHRLQSVTHVRQSAPDDHRHRVVEIRPPHLLFNVDRLYVSRVRAAAIAARRRRQR